MSHDTTLLSDRPTRRTTLAPCGPGGDYHTGLLLTVELKGIGSGSIELDGAETQALLRTLPPALLLAALGERGLTAPPTAAPENPFLALDDPAPGEER